MPKEFPPDTIVRGKNIGENYRLIRSNVNQSKNFLTLVHIKMNYK
jgi:hypothetical protein